MKAKTPILLLTLIAAIAAGEAASAAPIIPDQPDSLAMFEGRTAVFSVAASSDSPLSYHWRKNGAELADGGRISGSSTAALTVSNATMGGDDAGYDVVVSNPSGSVTSLLAVLSLVVSNSNPAPYEARLRELNPISYWRLNETNGSSYSCDFWGGIIATNEAATLGVAGPAAPDFTGFENTNSAGQYDPLSFSDTATSVSLLNNRSQFTLVGWFKPAASQEPRTGLFGQNDVAELGFHEADASGQAQLGLWTSSGAVFLSQTNVVPGLWYVVAGVASGTNLCLFLGSTNGGGGFRVLESTVVWSTTNYGNSPFPFRIGGGGILDPTGTYFNGSIDEVAAFDRALSVGELSDLFGAALTGGDLGLQITVQPDSLTIYSGRSATFHVSAFGSSPGYQWRKGGTPLVDGGTTSGASTTTLTIADAAAENSGFYEVVITNSSGSITSAVATLSVITPEPGSYEAAVVALNPFAYYRLNETNAPSSGAVPAFDFCGGHIGLYGIAAQNGFGAVQGPTTGFAGFEADNRAMQVSAGTPDSFATAPVGSLATNTVTFTAWLFPIGSQEAWSGLLLNRGGGASGGFNYNDQQMLSYTWNNNDGNTYGFISGLVIPWNQWSFVAVAISPSNAVLYLYNADVKLSATNAIAHTPDVFGNNWQIGHDSYTGNDGSRTFNGIIDEVALYLQTLTQSQLEQLYLASAGPVRLDFEHLNGQLILSWSYAGFTLQSAPTVTGTFTNVTGATSPYTNSATAPQQFFRLKLN
jgi:hypothetical protein